MGGLFASTNILATTFQGKKNTSSTLNCIALVVMTSSPLHLDGCLNINRESISGPTRRGPEHSVDASPSSQEGQKYWGISTLEIPLNSELRSDQGILE